MTGYLITDELKKRVTENLPVGLTDKALSLALNNWELNFEDFKAAVDYYKETKL